MVLPGNSGIYEKIFGVGRRRFYMVLSWDIMIRYLCVGRGGLYVVLPGDT